MKKLVKVLTILVIIAICLISFGGILISKQGQMKNILPEYSLGMDLTGRRVAKFVVSTETEEIIYDAEGKVTQEGKNEDGTLKEGYKKEEKSVNTQEALTEENYKKAKQIIEKRLTKMGVNQYSVKQNAQTGEIFVEIPEDTYTDEVIANLSYLGKFEIKDSETKEILLDNSYVKEASVVYGSTSTGTAVYLSVEFNKDGKQKLEEITKTYISTTDEEENTTTKKVSIDLDEETMIETYFSEPISNGILQLSIGTATTSGEQVSSYIKQGNMVASIIDSGKMDVKYKLEDNNYINITENNMISMVILGAICTILVIGFIYWIIRYKANGIFAVISYIGFIAISLIAIRYTNVVISKEAIVTLISVLTANYFMVQYVLKQFSNKENNKKEIIKKTYIRYASIWCPLVIIAVVFTFVTWLPIASIGMTLFWSLLVAILYNYITIQILFEVKK